MEKLNRMGTLLTRKEAADRLGISVVTLDELRTSRQLAYIQHKPNGKVWITEEAINDYLARANHPVRPPIRLERDTYRKRRA